MLPHIKRIRDTVACVLSAAALAAPSVLAAPARAQAIVPCNNVPALINAINAANASPNVSTILLAPNCVYHLTGDTGPLPAITTPVVITGSGSTIQRDEAAPEFRVLQVGAGGNLTLLSLSVVGGNVSGDGGGILVAAGGTLVGTLLNVTDNTASGNGGGIWSQGTVRLTSANVSGNHAGEEDGFGGGIYNSGSLTLTNTNVSANTAYSGAGITNDAGGTVVFTGGRIAANTAQAAGGLDNEPNGTVTLVNVVIEQNSGADGGGGIINLGSLTMRLGRITGNTATTPDIGIGGGIYNDALGTVTLVGVPVQNNVAAVEGGGIYNSGTVLPTLSPITNNTPDNCVGNPVPGCVG